ncbi:hypothetical protein KXR63_11360 [Stutzerimonas chloritidismutans]|uniref:hypothetical protein n=1 Tax=Stutzerimonas chloritidismutans TaxID=203192 RepID=UPI003F16C89C
MAIYFSSKTGGFYRSEINGKAIPEGATPISAERYMELINGQAQGKTIAADAAGRPILIDPPASEPTPEDIERNLTAALNRHLDAVAGQRRYDTRFTCSLRAGFPGPFQEEGQVFAAWMDACNMAAYQLMADVKAGSRKVPTEAELIAAMPVIEWPPSPIPAGAA